MGKAETEENKRVDIAIVLLDLVVIALGAAMLLLVVIPNSESSEQHTLGENSQLLSVRKFIAESEQLKHYRVSDSLWARLPGLVKGESNSGTAIALVSSEDVGRPLSNLDLSQRVRRVELIIECTEVSVLQRELVLERLQQRGVDHIHYQCARSGSDPSLSPRAASIGLAGLPAAVAQEMSLWPENHQNSLKAALLEAGLNLGSSATPNEPVLVVFKSPAFLTALQLALEHNVSCPASGLHLIGPSLEETALTESFVSILKQCVLLNVQYSDGI